MSLKGIFRTYNLYLLFAGLLSGAMIFAPLAYASNFESYSHVTIYGAWIKVEYPNIDGSQAVAFKELLKLPLNLIYVVISSFLSLATFFLFLYNKEFAKKRKWLWYGFSLAVVQLLVAALLRIFASVFLPDIEVVGNMESGFLREYLLHFFILYFLYRSAVRMKIQDLKDQAKIKQ